MGFDRIWRFHDGTGQALAASDTTVRSTQLTHGAEYSGWATVDVAIVHASVSTAVASTSGDPTWISGVPIPPFAVRVGYNDFVAVRRLGGTSGKLYLFKTRDLK